MSDSVDDARQRARYWPVPVLRAVPAAVVAMLITFSSNHSAGYGLTLFGAFAVVEGVVLGVGSARALPRGDRSRATALAQAVVTTICGIGAFALIGSGLTGLIAVVLVFAVVTGGLELAQGLRARGRSSAARDWITVGGLTLLLAVAFALTPPDYSQQLGGIEKVSGTLDSSIVLVGLLGAYLAVTAVFHVIAGLSHKWGTAAPRPASPDGAPHA